MPPQSDHPLQRFVRQPKVPYPHWDSNWDGRESQSKSTRHILLIRHGQYCEEDSDDSRRVLTALGRRQAELTGKRLVQLIKQQNTEEPGQNIDTAAGPMRIRTIHVSNMQRAKETARIIHAAMKDSNPSIVLEKPDPLLNEGLPAPIIPGRPDVGTDQELATEIAKHQDRLEAAFTKYFHRSDDHSSIAHDSEVIVCHGNVIRYFLMRALQLPPEAWLRWSLFNCTRVNSGKAIS